MNDWFEWNGVRCTQYGIHVLEQPPVTIPSERVTFTDVPGRSGSLTQLEGDDVYDDMVLTANCLIDDPSRIPEIVAWLRGSGTVTFANRQGGFYHARVVNQIEGTITAATLNVNDIFANNAIIRSLIAANLDVDTLFAREATLTALNAMDITGNTYLKLMVAGKAEQSALDALEERVSNAELKITADAIVSTVTGSETYIQDQQKIYDDMDTLLGYRLEILAETVFLSENKRSTTLTAHVWHGNTEVTDSIAAERFKWTRESEDATADAVWNSAHQGFKSILVTTADVLRQASFRCELTE